MRHPMAEKRVVYEIPNMTSATVRDVEYRRDGETSLTMRVYRAADAAPGVLQPAVVLVLGYSDLGAVAMLGCRLSEMEVYVSWSQLLAASGMTAVTYVTGTDPATDTRGVLAHLREHGAGLGIDCERVAVMTFSGNVPNALSLLIDPGAIPIRSAALLCGFMLDIDGSTGVAAGAARWRFVNPTTGKTIDDLPGETPLFIARAGRDENPGVNQTIDAFVGAALQRNLPLTLVNHPTGPHAFDILEDSHASRTIIRQVLEFFRATLVEDSTVARSV